MAKRKIKDIVESVDASTDQIVESTNNDEVITNDISKTTDVVEDNQSEQEKIIFDLQNKLDEATEKFEQLLKKYSEVDQKCSDLDVKNSELQFENSRLTVENQFLKTKIEKLSAGNLDNQEQIKQPISSRPLNADIPGNLSRHKSMAGNYKDIIEEFNKNKNEYWN